ncbi:hypothetical protein JW859_02745 [bacterium]|nr:hypothetical protein [bacterium]
MAGWGIAWGRLLRSSLIVLGLLLLSTGCSGGKPAATATPVETASPDVEAPVAAMEEIPAPSILAALPGRFISADPVIALTGNQFSAGLPKNRVSAAGELATFAPAWPLDGGAAGGMAFALYEFNLESFSGDPAVRFVFGRRPDDGGVFWAGLADWSADSWRWFAGPLAESSYRLNLAALAPYSDSGRVLVAVVMLGEWEVDLSLVSFEPYDEVENNDSLAAPNALPDREFTGWRGSLGSGTGYPGYDGDTTDCFSFNGPDGESVQLRFYPADPSLSLSLELYDVNGDLDDTDAADEPGDYVTCRYRFPTGHGNPAKVQLNATAGHGDYAIRCIWGTSPTADFTAAPLTGDAPLTVEFDGSGSTDDGALIAYEWDWDGDGIYDFDSHPQATTQHTYTADGIYWPKLYVSDDDYLGDSESGLMIVVGEFPYDETENNDTITQLNSLPAFNFIGWRGSLGDAGATYRGYDGDDEDLFAIDVASGDTVTFRVHYPAATGPLYLEIRGGSSSIPIARSEMVSPGLAEVRATFEAGHATPYNLAVCAGVMDGGMVAYGDYTLDGIFGPPPQIVLTADPLTGNVPLAVTFDASGTTDPGGALTKFEWDWDGDGTFDYDSGLTAIVDHTYNSVGGYPGTLRVWDDDGFASTDWVLILVGDPYDEVEPNDADWERNTLPTAPFAGWRGNLGIPGYDDEHDLLAVDTPVVAGQAILLSFTFDNPASLADAILIDASSTMHVSMSDANPVLLQYTFMGGELAPFRLHLQGLGIVPSDYTVAAILGQAPTAQLTADPTTGAMPLTVNFNAGGSSDGDGSIVLYEWDWDGDGSWDASGPNAAVSHQYNDDWIFYPAVRVTDDDGFTAAAALEIYSSAFPYDERENNDSQSKANPLALSGPGTSFSGLRGSLMIADGYRAYDGDNTDMFSFNAVADKTVHFTLTQTGGSGTQTVELRTGSYSLVAGPAASIDYTLPGTATGVYYVIVCVGDLGGQSDYSLSGSMDP